MDQYPVILLPQSIVCICEFQMQNSFIAFLLQPIWVRHLEKVPTEYYVITRFLTNSLFMAECLMSLTN